MGYGRIKFRKTWGAMSPVERVHSTKRGKKGYDRNEWKKADKSGDNNEKDC